MKPDFFLPDLKILVEVGPAMHDVFERKINKGQDLSDATGLPVLVTFGFPEYRTGYKDPITYGSRIRHPQPAGLVAKDHPDALPRADRVLQIQRPHRGRRPGPGTQLQLRSRSSALEGQVFSAVI